MTQTSVMAALRRAEEEKQAPQTMQVRLRFACGCGFVCFESRPALEHARQTKHTLCISGEVRPEGSRMVRAERAPRGAYEPNAPLDATRGAQ